MQEPVKIDPTELEYREYLKKQADLENQQWIENMKRERESEAQLQAYRERKALVDKEIAEMQKKPVNNDEIEPKARPKNDFEP